MTIKRPVRVSIKTPVIMTIVKARWIYRAAAGWAAISASQGPGELAGHPPLGHEKVFLPVPVVAGQFVGDFNPVAVRIVEVDANGNTVVADVADGHVLFLEPGGRTL